MDGTLEKRGDCPPPFINISEERSYRSIRNMSKKLRERVKLKVFLPLRNDLGEKEFIFPHSSGLFCKQKLSKQFI